MQHGVEDLKQYQMLPLEQKIQMSKQRIKDWYSNWTTLEIQNTNTKKKRYKAVDTRNGDPEVKLRKNEVIIGEYTGAVYVSFSGGKDSTVLKHIVDSMYDDVPSLFVNTGLEFPEIQDFVRKQPNVEIVRPQMRFDEVIKTYGYPIISKDVSECVFYGKQALAKGNYSNTKLQKLLGTLKKSDGTTSAYNKSKWAFLLEQDFDISHKCCDVMKKKPAHDYDSRTGRVAIIGTMASESRARKDSWLKYGCNAWDSDYPESKPLSFWTEQDILEYILLYDLEIAAVYGDIVGIDQTGKKYERAELIDLARQPGGMPKNISLKTTGAQRTGCIFCGFGAYLEKNPNRFEQLKISHPKQYEFCMFGGEYDENGLWKPNKEGLGMGHVLDCTNIKY